MDGRWGILPIGTYKSQKTIEESIVEHELWTMDQQFGILNAQVPLPMTVSRLEPKGGVFMYNPIAETPECVGMVYALEECYRPVQHIAVPSVTLKCKVYGGVFAQKFPTAKSLAPTWTVQAASCLYTSSPRLLPMKLTRMMERDVILLASI